MGKKTKPTAGKQTRENCGERLPAAPQVPNSVLQTGITSPETRR
jgi:hypothetical protein